MSSSSRHHRRGHAPKDSGISMAAKPEPDAAPTPPPSSSSKKEDYFICERCKQPRAVYRRLPYLNTGDFVCDYCHQPPTLKEVRDVSIVFEMKWCRQGNHEAPAINFRDEGNMSCYHCADRCALYPSKPLPGLPLRPDSDSRWGEGAAAAAPGNEMEQQNHGYHHHHHAVTQQRQRQEERPQIQYYSGSYKPRGHFENSSRPPKTLQTYHPQVRPPNMGNYTIKPKKSAPLQRLDPNTELRDRPQPQPEPKIRPVYGGRTYHEVPNPNEETPLKTRRRPSMTSHHEPRALPHDDILKTFPPPPSKAVSANRTPSTKAQAHHYHKPQQQQKPPQQRRQKENQRPPPQSSYDIPPLVPSWESDTHYYQPHHHQNPPQQQRQRPQSPPPPKRPKPKTQYDKPPAAPSWELKMRRALEQKKPKQQHHNRSHSLEPQASTEQARADSEVLGPQATCPACGKHRPTYSELIEAYGFCFHCLRRHLMAAGELLKCPSCRQLLTRQDFMKYDRDGLVVKRRTEECVGCQWRHRNGAKKLSAVLCGGPGWVDTS
ncbi:hypothetical protein PG994_010499 [Apiospora phragmitis]|uniref:Uncharacterized protein n=1 Tax=Apiospora phragmitis TaxID=2905665 RepID=A0ABR1TSQ1_9PEZI